MSRFVIEGPALPITSQKFSEVVGSVPTLQTPQTSPEGSALQRIPVVEGSALPSTHVEDTTIQVDSSPEGPALQSSISTEDSVLQETTSPRSVLKDTSPPSSPSLERIRAIFFPSLQLSSSATPMSQSGGFKFAPERDSGLPPLKSLPKATFKSVPLKKSQKGSVPSSLPIVDASSTPRAQDSVPHVGVKSIVSHITPTVDPDLVDLCVYDVSDDEESGRTPTRGSSDHSQPPPSRPDTRGFQPHPIIPVQGFVPVRSSKTGSSKLFQAPPGPFQQGLAEEELKIQESILELKQADRRMLQVAYSTTCSNCVSLLFEHDS
ncbi:hypothetical protein GEMRC1_000300 [Eukaryota sp. GEM-RC1]